MNDWQLLSGPADPADPDSVAEWLEDQVQAFATEIEDALEAIVHRVYRAFIRSVDETAVAEPDAITAAGDVNIVDEILPRWQMEAPKLLSKIEPVYYSGAVSAFTVADGKNVIPDYVVAEWADVVNTQAVEYMAQAKNRLRGVGETVWKDVRARAVTAVEKGLSRDKLRAQLLDLEENFSRYRADTIARTEMNTAYSVGDFQADVALGEFGPAEKVWRTTLDGRERETHRDANRQTVKFSESFSVGGTAMLHPHAPGSPAAEVVNCRCRYESLYPGDTRPDGTTVPEPDQVSATPEVPLTDEAFPALTTEEARALREMAAPGGRLTAKQADAWLDYQGEGYRLINLEVQDAYKAAAELGEDPVKILKGGRTKARYMEDAFAKEAREAPRDMTLFRGSSGTEPLRPVKVGEVLTQRRYWSTSSSQEVAERFVRGEGGGFGLLQEVATPPHRRMYSIRVPKGTRLAPARADEAEWLIHHGDSVRVTRIWTRTDGVEIVEAVLEQDGVAKRAADAAAQVATGIEEFQVSPVLQKTEGTLRTKGRYPRAEADAVKNTIANDDYVAVSSYTGNTHRPLNEWLRGIRTPAFPDQLEVWEDTTKRLDRLISEAKPEKPLYLPRNEVLGD